MAKVPNILSRVATSFKAFFFTRNVITYLCFCVISAGIWYSRQYQHMLEESAHAQAHAQEILNESSSMLTERDIILPIGTRGVPSGNKLVLFADHVRVHISLPSDQYNSITATDFQAICTYPTSDRSTLPVEVSCSSPYVHIMHIEPQQVEYIIQ
ncbi:MAG: hypothetical protein MJZ89_02310 [Paludibacteraceae bacterium]|nr:hypothetical protein [Paludibacteraceae bacterium]